MGVIAEYIQSRLRQMYRDYETIEDENDEDTRNYLINEKKDPV